jgi:serine/threonine protein kinase
MPLNSLARTRREHELFQRKMIGNETIWREYEKLETMGQGVYGKVYKARSRYNGDIVAIKKTAYDPEGIAASTVREIAMLKRIQSHANIVKLHHVFRYPSKNNSSILNMFVVMEYADCDLQRYMAGYNSLPVDQIKIFTMQILKGLRHCHELGIIHRDLKPSNILVHNDHIIKIADFGLSRRQYFPNVAVSPNVYLITHFRP